MLRAVLAVALAAALLGTSLPAVEEARADHADARVRGELGRVERGIDTLVAHDDPVGLGEAGAREHVTVRVPARSWGTVGVAHIALGAAPGQAVRDTDGSDVLAWKLDDGRQRVLRIGVDLRVADAAGLADDGTPLVLRRPGRHRLALGLVRVDGRPVVVVRRGFKSDDGATTAHAGAATPVRRGG